MKRFISRSAVVLFFIGVVFVADGQSASVVVGNGKKVKFDYTLKVSGQVVETTVGRAPMEYVQGAGKVIPGLESQLKGLKVGDKKTFIVLPKDGYGEENPKAFSEFPKKMFPKDFVPQKGMIIELQNEQKQVVPAIITEVKADTVLLNFNHPLAGKKLEFDVKIVSIE